MQTRPVRIPRLGALADAAGAGTAAGAAIGLLIGLSSSSGLEAVATIVGLCGAGGGTLGLVSVLLANQTRTSAAGNPPPSVSAEELRPVLGSLLASNELLQSASLAHGLRLVGRGSTMTRRTELALNGTKGRSFSIQSTPSDTARIANYSLVLFGPAGIGKSVWIRELFEHLLKSAIDGSSDKVPVLVEMAAWPDFQSDLLSFVAAQLNASRSPLRPNILHQLVREDRVILLLDGLDEVPSEAATTCLRAISDFVEFQERNGLLPRLVATSRPFPQSVGDSQGVSAQLSHSLQFEGRLEPLTKEEVLASLKMLSNGDDLVKIVEANAPSLELLATPFWHSIFTEVAQDIPTATVKLLLEKRELDPLRRDLFEAHLSQRVRYAGARTPRRVYVRSLAGDAAHELDYSD